MSTHTHTPPTLRLAHINASLFPFEWAIHITHTRTVASRKKWTMSFGHHDSWLSIQFYQNDDIGFNKRYRTFTLIQPSRHWVSSRRPHGHSVDTDATARYRRQWKNCCKYLSPLDSQVNHRFFFRPTHREMDVAKTIFFSYIFYSGSSLCEIPVVFDGCRMAPRRIREPQYLYKSVCANDVDLCFLTQRNARPQSLANTHTHKHSCSCSSHNVQVRSLAVSLTLLFCDSSADDWRDVCAIGCLTLP